MAKLNMQLQESLYTVKMMQLCQIREDEGKWWMRRREGHPLNGMLRSF